MTQKHDLVPKKYPIKDSQLLRRKLLKILLGPNPPREASKKFRVIAKGDKALAMIEKQKEFCFNYYDKTIPGHGMWKLLRRGYEGDVTWSTSIVEYSGWHKNVPVQAILRVPKKARNAPALLCLHGHVPGLAMGKEEVGYFAEALTAEGYITLAPDALPFGPRRPQQFDEWEFEYQNGYGFLAEKVEFCESLLRGECLLGMQMWELMRAVDLLSLLDEVDSKRIGTIGHSQGGVHSWWLGAIDPRVAAVVSSASVSTYAEMERQHTISALFNFVPGVRIYADQPDLLSLIAPRPLFISVCEQDYSFPIKGARDVNRQLSKVYKLYGQKDKFKFCVDPGDHAFPPEIQRLAFDWLNKWL